MPGCPLGWSANDGHQAPVPTGKQAFFRETREVARRREDFRRYSGVFRGFKKPRKAAVFFESGGILGGKGRNPRISRIRESADTSVFRFSVPIIRPGFRWGGFGSESGAGVGHFAVPVEFTIFRFFRCFACSLSLIHQGNQLGLASFFPPIRRISCTTVHAARSVSGFVRADTAFSYSRTEESGCLAGVRPARHPRGEGWRTMPED